MITAIDKIQPLSPSAAKESSSLSLDDNMFGSIFKAAIENVETSTAERVEAEYLLSTGQLDNPAELMIAISKSQLAVDFLVQMRTRALDAYKELTSISM